MADTVDSAEKIAAKLTEAQRAVIRDGLRDEETAAELARMGLCWKMADHFDFDPVRYVTGGWKFRHLGLEVRQVLQSNQDPT